MKIQARRNRKSTDPAKTATMAGGLFAVERANFWRIGGYDEGMVGWGGEDLELSSRLVKKAGEQTNTFVFQHGEKMWPSPRNL